MFAEYSSKEFEEKYTYSGNDLGAIWAEDATAFRIWAPLAQSVSLCLYSSGTPWADDLIHCLPLERGNNGTWHCSVNGNLHGVYYTFSIDNNGTVANCLDPYAAACGVNGVRGMVVNMNATNPKGWEYDQSPVISSQYTDHILYEMHIRDISTGSGAGIQAKGKYLGLTEAGTKTRFGFSTGLDHIAELGVTHVHLLPVYDFGSVDEADTANRQYNWGYDPVNYNIPEGSYSTNPYDGSVRIRELKQMIQTLHQHGIGVIMDVVYNHVYHTFEYSFNQIVPGYFSRQNKRGHLSNGSACGNDTASERSMVRKFIVDSVNFWADEYHIDGFRFDLVGLLDVETINELVASVRKKHPNIMFYGEGWDIHSETTKENVALAIQRNAYQIPHFAFFNDSVRDTIRGSVFDSHAKGFVSGESIAKEHLLECFSGRTWWTNQPEKIVNYVSCHDNHTLHDRIAEALPNCDEHELAKRCRMAAAFNILSQGIPFFQAGEELLRSKASSAGHYVSNSYRSSDRINAIKWNSAKEPDVSKTSAFYKGLIRLRKEHDLFRLQNPDEICRKVSLYHNTDDNIVAFYLEDSQESILLGFNPDRNPGRIFLPMGEWKLYIHDDRADIISLGTASGCLDMAPLTVVMVVRDRTES